MLPPNKTFYRLKAQVHRAHVNFTKERRGESEERGGGDISPVSKSLRSQDHYNSGSSVPLRLLT